MRCVDRYGDRPARAGSIDSPRRIRKVAKIQGHGEDYRRRAETKEWQGPHPESCLVVLVDTSVWVRFFANRTPYASQLDRLLQQDEVAGHDLIYGELLIGDTGGRPAFLEAYERMYQIPVVRHREVASFVRIHKLHGQGIGWIDANLLASALVAEIPLWTADERLAQIATQLRIGYNPA